MQKWIGAGVLAAAAGIGLAWQQGWFGTTREPLTAYVPADTVLYLGGQAAPDQLEQLGQLPLLAHSRLQANQLLAALEQTDQRHPDPSARFLTALLADFIRHADTYADLIDHYGMDLSRPQALYLDGLVPVLRFGLKDEAAFWQVLERLSADSGLAPRQITLADTPVKLWRLTPASARTLELAVSVRNGTATLTLLHELDQPDDQLQRLALARPAQALADSGELAQLQRRHGFDDSLVALLHLQRLAEGLLEPDRNGFGQDLAALLRALDRPLPGAALEPACRADLLTLAEQVPRLVAGNTRAPGGTPLQLSSRSVLEIRHAEVLHTLATLRGHLPGHTAARDDQLLGFGLGLDIDQLVPAASALFNRLTGYQTQCAQLARLQRQLSGANPAMLALFTGMVQGTKGLGFSLYELDLDRRTGQPSRLDALLSIATTQPQPLLGMLAMTPQGRQWQIPTDGSLREIDLSALIPGLTLKAGLVGQHLVAFTGARAQQAVEQLRQESLQANGISRLAVDYARVAELIEAIPPQFTRELATDRGSGCVAQAQLAWMLRSQGARVDYTSDITDQGISTELQMTLTPPAAVDIDPVGRYRLIDQSFDCRQGDVIGEEEIRADGSGHYRYTVDGCELYRNDYQWRRQGQRLLFTPTREESRDDCSAAWQAQPLTEAECLLLPADEGFRCLYSDGEQQHLFHYRPLD